MSGNRSPRGIRFLYAEQYRQAGTTVMRGQQLADIARQAVPGRPIALEPKEQPQRNADLFLTKGVLLETSGDELAGWKSRGNRLIFDPVDWTIPPELLDYADTIVAASLTAYDAYRESYPGRRIVLVNHHVDPRIRALDFSRPPAMFKAAYFGLTKNTYRKGKLETLVDFVPVDTGKQDYGWLAKLPGYTFHYAIRRSTRPESYKPFLKGFTAAACGANVLIQGDQAEAVRWLGASYPYLVWGPVTQASIVKALDRARRSFGSAEWQRGLETMRSIRSAVSAEAVGRQLAELFG
jgi:hypothetical protein